MYCRKAEWVSDNCRQLVAEVTELRGSGQGQGQGMAAEGPCIGRATSGSLLRRLRLKKPKDRSVSSRLVTEHICKSGAPAQTLFVSIHLCACLHLKTVALSALMARSDLGGPLAHRSRSLSVAKGLPHF